MFKALENFHRSLGPHIFYIQATTTTYLKQTNPSNLFSATKILIKFIQKCGCQQPDFMSTEY
ncbi:hypothetical protein DERF_003548 [Dermatophagoides farinae]|uniref:Uncharacterized protein n=1 Tax=Dermatophagoides farinae TaxID=6954 RepID=A0A922LCL0_DERFA|nr:hypothetical protein DERF_003548 [Dermatophagoides farinae]